MLCFEAEVPFFDSFSLTVPYKFLIFQFSIEYLHESNLFLRFLFSLDLCIKIKILAKRRKFLPFLKFIFH